jgi:hypothetical protein
MPSANDTQVGGSHYVSPLQHWDMVAGNDVDYFLGQVSKYVTRWRGKNGLQDLQKSLHFLEKKMEVIQHPVGLVDMDAYANSNRLSEQERVICWLCAHWGGKLSRLQEAAVHIKALIDSVPPENWRILDMNSRAWQDLPEGAYQVRGKLQVGPFSTRIEVLVP